MPVLTNEGNVVLHGITGEARVVVDAAKGRNAREDRVGLWRDKLVSDVQLVLDSAGLTNLLSTIAR